MNSIKVIDGTVSIGDFAYFPGGKIVEVEVIDFIRSINTVRSLTSNKVLSQEKGVQILCRLNSGSEYTYNPESLYTSNYEASKVEIANGIRVGIGQMVWVWRAGSQPSLVVKEVVATDYRKNWIQCSYTDKLWPRKEKANSLFSTELEALNAFPEKAKSLENAYTRSGRFQGHRADSNLSLAV